ncbi:hypothetical protein B0H11DRAFT_2246568 [Mycena galericulata]|nr:hypothetical protein B0H11DRAFT_2246568 [Mycena galericulata]
MLNYLNLMRAKVVSLAVFFVVWTYFRHYISIRILWSLRYEFHLVPEEAQVFAPMQGLYMALWMRDQMFYSLCVLQALNLFWYYLILRIIVRSIMTSETDDNRSDEDEDESVSIPKPAPVSLHAVPELQLSDNGEKGLRASIGREKPRGAGARAGTLGQGLSVQTNANENGHANGNGNGNGFYGGYAGKGMGMGMGKTLVDVEAAGLFQDPTGKEE